MYPASLTTNEVKNSAGTEEEFLESATYASKREWSKSGAAPNAPHKLSVSHTTIGQGLTQRRRSLVRFDKVVEGASGSPVSLSAYCVVDLPIGDSNDTTEFANIVANLVSTLASTGSDTTIKYDGSGYGALSLIKGEL